MLEGPDPQEVEKPVPDDSADGFVRAGLLFYGAMAVLAVLWRTGFHGEEIWRAGGGAPVSLGTALLWGAGTGLFIVGVSALVTGWTGWGEKLSREMGRMLGGLGVPDALLLAFASGLAEELLFRGALQPRIGWFWAGLVFGLVHLVPRRVFLPWTLFAVLSGWLLGLLFDLTGHLAAPIAAHTVVNGINLPLLVREERRRRLREGTLSRDPREG